MNLLQRWLGIKQDQPKPHQSIPMTEHRVDMSFRIFWTKISTEWDLDRIRHIRKQVQQVTQQANFQKNLVERRYAVEDLDEQAHSGASLLALIEVLDALEKYQLERQQEDSET
jgi:hypothetical protein